MNALEEDLVERIKANQINLEDALLIIGGCESEENLNTYRSKLAELIDRFSEAYPNVANVTKSRGERLAFDEQIATGKALFQFLWEDWTKESRYVYETTIASTNQLPQLINYQLDPEKSNPLGNCQGLTLLYAVIGMRLGLDLCMGKLNWQDCNGKKQGEHTFCTLESGNKKVLVENTSKEGFDWDMSKYTSRYEPSNIFFSDIEALAAVAYSERGYLKAKQNDLEGALSDYNRALSLLPEYNLVLVKRGSVKVKLNDRQGAILDYEAAIRQNPYWSVPLYNKRRIEK